jgi:hypothetical protein
MSSNPLKFLYCKKIGRLMTPVSEAFKKEHPHKKEYWQNELESLGIEPKRPNDLNDKTELEALAETIKQVYYQDYKTAYSNENSSTASVQSTRALV